MYPLPDFIKRLEMVESSGNPNAISMRNDQPIAYGARQITPTTGRAIAERMGRNDLLALDDAAFRKALLDPTTNRALSDYHINELSKRYGGDQRLMAIAYNAGQGRADAYRNTGNFAALPAETQGYVRKLGLLGSGDEMAGGGGSGILAGGGADPMLGGSAASGSPFEGASERDKWVAWGQALSQAFRGRDNSEAMGRLSALENQGVEQNKTYQALIKRGLDPATAEWAVRDPVVMREMVQQLFAPKARNMQIGEIFDPATGRPVKVLIDQTTGEYQTLGGVAAPDPTKVPNLQAIDIYDDQTGGKRKMSFNPQTGEMKPLGGVAAAGGEVTPYQAERLKLERERLNLQQQNASARTASGRLPAAVATKNKEIEIAATNLDNALSDYESLVVGGTMADGTTAPGTGYAFTGTERDAVNTARRNIQMQMKELFTLGAITGPDMQILNDMLVDPTASVGPVNSLYPLSDERGAFSVLANTAGHYAGLGTGIADRVKANTKQLRQQFRQMVANRRAAVGAQGVTASPAAGAASATSSGDLKSKYGLE